MNRTAKIFTIGLLTAISTLFQRCTQGWETFHEGIVKGKKYVVQSRAVTEAFSSVSRIEYRLRYNELPYLHIDANTTDWDIVYSTDIFGKDTFNYITTNNVSYSNNPAEKIGAKTFLYLLPDNVSKQDYDEYVVFFESSEWQKTDSICIEMTKDGESFPHIVGLVHGDPLTYIQNFRGMYLGQEYIFRVENDGRVRLVDTGELGEVGTGLSPKVQMPGKIIHFLSSSSGGITKDDLGKFKNELGQTPLEYFTFLQSIEAN